MSLKARLRISVALLMSAMVAILCGLYIRSYLQTAFQRTEDIAKSVGNQVQAAILEELQRAAAVQSPAPTTPDQAKAFWIRTVQDDPVIDGALRRAVTYWHMIAEVFITDEQGRWLVGSRPLAQGGTEPRLPLLSGWNQRSLPANLKQIYVDRSDTELLRPIALVGENKPVLVVHIVVSALFIHESLSAGLEYLAWIGVAALIASLILALVLPDVVLNPLERLNRRLDLIATGGFSPAPSGPDNESKEFAAVFTKVNLLGEQFQGAQQNADQLRGNVEQLLERLEDAVMLFDSAGRLTVAGSTVGGVLGLNPVEITGRVVDEIFPVTSDFGALVIPAVRAGSAVSGQVVPWTVNGRSAAILVSVLPLRRDSETHGMGTLVTLRDAETRGELVAQLDVASRLAAVSQLTRGVAHEIKNPLNGIRLHIELLRLRLQEDAPELGIVASEISRLDRVVKTFLDFNRPVEPRMCLLDLNQVAGEIAGLVKPDAASRNVELVWVAAPRPAVMNGDLDLLKQALLNVVVNGVESMAGGSGRLSMEVSAGQGRVEATVTDTGPGIPPDLQDKIFNLYFTTKAQGSGIGLAMAFRSVQLLDGKIELSSEIGRGTTFRFSFPEASSHSKQREIGLSKTHRA